MSHIKVSGTAPMLKSTSISHQHGINANVVAMDTAHTSQVDNIQKSLERLSRIMRNFAFWALVAFVIALCLPEVARMQLSDVPVYVTNSNGVRELQLTDVEV